jgi:hypothetical protein
LIGMGFTYSWATMAICRTLLGKETATL